MAQSNAFHFCDTSLEGKCLAVMMCVHFSILFQERGLARTLEPLRPLQKSRCTIGEHAVPPDLHPAETCDRQSICARGATRYIFQGWMERDVSASGTGGGGGGNSAPTLVGDGLPSAVNLTVGDPAASFDLDALFADADGDDLTYSLSGKPGWG